VQQDAEEQRAGGREARERAPDREAGLAPTARVQEGREPRDRDDDDRRAYFASPPERETAEHAIWAGEAASMVRAVEGAGDVVRALVAEAGAVLRDRAGALAG
jgi:hypothetical protein